MGSCRLHPFPLYRKFAVPVALSTDDEGIERIDLTNEYVSAVESYGLTYADLKQMVRNSLEYDFLPGASLWERDGLSAGRRRLPRRCSRQRFALASLRRFSQGEREGKPAMGARAALRGLRGWASMRQECLTVALRHGDKSTDSWLETAP